MLIKLSLEQHVADAILLWLDFTFQTVLLVNLGHLDVAPPGEEASKCFFFFFCSCAAIRAQVYGI